MRRSLKSTPTWRPSLLIAFHLHNPPVVTWGAVKGVPQGTFVWTLNSSARRFILSGFGVQFRIGRFRTAFLESFPFVRRSKLIGASHLCVSQSLACNHHSYPASIRTLKGPHGGPVHVGVRS